MIWALLYKHVGGSGDVSRHVPRTEEERITATILGPILRFNGADDSRWHVSPLLQHQDGERAAWRFDLTAERRNGNENREVPYTVDGKPGSFWVPESQAPLRLVYVSCNGPGGPPVRKANALWSEIQEKHDGGGKPYHVLLMGGDQLYADRIWHQHGRVAALVKWQDTEDLEAPFEPMKAAVSAFYFDLYCERWSQKEPAEVLARIATLMMWDDHDIFDGWGSHEDKLRQCPVYQGILGCAQDAFRVFQLHEHPNNVPAILNPEAFCVRDRQTGPSAKLNLSQGFTIDDFAILALDTRSERTDESIISEESWEAIFKWMDSLRGLQHLLVMAAVPVVYPSYAALEKALRLAPGSQELEDDLRDQWRSQPHREQRKRLIHRLLRFAAQEKCRVTLISGDVHLAALGVLESTRYPSVSPNTQRINQLISSPIVNRPQPGISRLALEHLAREVEEIDTGITARMLDFPGSRDHFCGERNWLSLSFDKERRIWAEWFVEGHAHSRTKVIHPPGMTA